MEPRIQYAKTADGVSIAFWTMGEGMPLVCMCPPPWSHTELEWRIPEFRRFYNHPLTTGGSSHTTAGGADC